MPPVTVDSTIRKSVSALSLDDLRACGIWEYAIDEEGRPGQDETTVRPCIGRERASGRGELVRTRFITAGGMILFGFATAWGRRDVEVAQPVIVLEDGRHVGLWWGAITETLEGAYSTLGMTRDEVFPLVYRADVPIAGAPLFGELDGFSGLGPDLRTIVVYA